MSIFFTDYPGCRNRLKFRLYEAEYQAENLNYVLYFADFFCKHELVGIEITAFNFKDYSDFECAEENHAFKKMVIMEERLLNTRAAFCGYPDTQRMCSQKGTG